MEKYPVSTSMLLCCLLFMGCSTTAPPIDDKPGDNTTAYGVGGRAQLFDDMGDYQRSITTRSLQAQRYFNQGLKWIYGFNHDEAVRSFTQAAELDPTCAMAWWGVAYAQGPNYNASGMNEARQAAAWQATQKALAQLDDETPVEVALIQALESRYQDPTLEEKVNQNTLKANFAEIMAEVWDKFPNDPDVGTIYADAMMVKSPWRLYKADGTVARDETSTIVSTLETIFQFAPDHPGACHFYIHAVEASTDKKRGIPPADRLSVAVPISGHLTHMPSHLYVQVGMWDRAVEQNVLAIEADRRYLDQSPVQYRQRGYAAHNGHMLAFAGMMVGREKEALAGAHSVWDMPEPIFKTMGKRYDRAMCAKYEVLRRFGRWDELLAEPAPPEFLNQTTAVWRACRAVAFAAKKDFNNAKGEHAAFQLLLAKNPKNNLFLLNDRFIAAEIALQQDKWDEAIPLLEEAVQFEDKLGYGEPPRWIQPVRHTLGAVLLKAERHADAERIYREDLEKWPGNGWSLFGLTRSLEGQGKTEQAAQSRAAFDLAWANADNPLETSCKCIPRL